MALYIKRTLALALSCMIWSAACAGSEAAPPPYREADWEELMPETWRPEKVFDGLDVDNLPDDDPRVEKAFEAFMAELANAPVNEAMNGQRVKIPGFVAPLDWEKENELKEFLLVPYFGACIHMPPPPPNQIIYIKLEKPLKKIRSMDAVMVYGTIFIEKNDSGSMGASGYGMRVDKVEPHKK